MDNDTKDIKIKRMIAVECTSAEWLQIKLALVYGDTKLSTITKRLLLKWSEKNQTPPPDKEDSELSL